jgi:hypothetical protein
MSSDEQSRITRQVKKQFDNTLGFQTTLQNLYRLFLPLIFTVLALAWAFYPESYELNTEFISDLGRIFSRDEGIRNLKSQITMSIGFGVISLFALTITSLYFFRFFLLQKEKRNGTLIFFKGFFNFLLAFGAFGIAFPTDSQIFSLLHGIGAGIFLFSFAVLNLLMQAVHSYSKWQIRKEEDVSDFTIDIVIAAIVLLALLLLIIFYIWNYLTADTLIESTAIKMQKIVLVVDSVAIWRLDIDDM